MIKQKQNNQSQKDKGWCQFFFSLLDMLAFEISNNIKSKRIKNGQEKSSLEGQYDSIYSISFCLDFIVLFFGIKDNPIINWDITRVQEIFKLEGYYNFVYPICFFSDRNTLTLAIQDNTIRLWMSKRFKKSQLKGHKKQYNHMTSSRCNCIGV
ncbi:unnamed protein product [Paramecium octaurelia]|uniref:Uncharacterized protein n=1 Tax=Paramecium octaurelia TaxID=43137 RepID=A0A8S1YAZ0_PAROT|nr:unnamed protein product [Paramecium octaurelia]